MKISITLLFILLSLNTYAKGLQESEKKEIIGSGIFSVNNTRTFDIDESSNIYLDKELIDFNTFEIIGSGFKIQTTLLEDVNGEMTTGTVYDLNLISNIQGPVTSVLPLMVLEQPVLITADTIQTQQEIYELNQELLLSGFVDKNNSLKATKIMGSINTNWKLQGYVSHINKKRFNIGTLIINRDNEDILDCNKNIKNGLLVEIIMEADNSYQAGNAINSLLSVRCLTNKQNQPNLQPMVIQGFVTQEQGNGFWMNDIYVKNTHETIYQNGESSFINSAVNLEVQGLFNPETSELEADFIRFLDHRIELAFPVYPNDINLDESIDVNGLVFYKTPQTLDNHGILSSGLDSARQVEILGFVDANGDMYISTLKLKGQPNFQLISLRGDIHGLTQPLFSLLNFQIDGNSNSLFDENNRLIDSVEFFQNVQAGSQVQIKNGEYSHDTNSIINATISIKSSNNGSNQKGKVKNNHKKEIIGSGIINASVLGTITNISKRLKSK